MKIVRNLMKYFVVGLFVWVLVAFLRLLLTPHPDYTLVFSQGLIAILDAGLVYMWWVVFPEQDKELDAIKQDIAQSKERLQAALKASKSRISMLDANEKELFDKLYDQL